jgi:hypothetical protein
MNVEKMVLKPAVDMLVLLTQAVVHGVTAAKYVMLGIHEFKEELDAYTPSTPRYKIGLREPAESVRGSSA